LTKELHFAVAMRENPARISRMKSGKDRAKGVFCWRLGSTRLRRRGGRRFVNNSRSRKVVSERSPNY
jgi:hypothetical protein